MFLLRLSPGGVFIGFNLLRQTGVVAEAGARRCTPKLDRKTRRRPVCPRQFSGDFRDSRGGGSSLEDEVTVSFRRGYELGPKKVQQRRIGLYLSAVERLKVFRIVDYT